MTSPSSVTFLVTFTNPVDGKVHKAIEIQAMSMSEAINQACSRWDIIDHILARQFIEARRL